MSNVTPIKSVLTDAAPAPDLGEILGRVNDYLGRFVAYPSDHARVAHVLWIAHTHLMDCWDTTPRLAFMSAEKESGKTRALEVTALLVPNPILSISASPAVIVRLVSAGTPTILYDEIDGVFGSAKIQEANTDLRSVLNGGYRRGAKVHRCTTHGKKIETEELNAFAAVALAGLRELPDTLASRSIYIRMKRRAPNEQVESFRYRLHASEAEPIKEALADWCLEHSGSITMPELPPGIEDRSADCWEPLLAVADAAGGQWPKLAWAAAVALDSRTADETISRGVELLTHIREAFDAEDKLWIQTLLDKLCSRDESPWKDIYGKPLNDRGLGQRLRPYGIKSKPVRIGASVQKGYRSEDFDDAWKRYCTPPVGYTGYTGYKIDNQNKNVTNVTNVTEGGGREREVDDERWTDHEGEARYVGEGASGAGLAYPGGGLSQHDGVEQREVGLFPREQHALTDHAGGEGSQGRHGEEAQACQGCDGVGCPYCRPEQFGLPRRRGGAA